MSKLWDRAQRALGTRYVMKRKLGEGGSATVFLAEDPRNRRLVAIKVLRPDIAESVGADRFQREIRIAASMVHPHVLPLHDAGDVDGLVYYVMPFVEGETLKDRIRRDGPLPIADAVRIGRELSAGLAYAHSLGVVHRDVKPANIFLTGSHAILGDFGIATALAADGEDLTETGTSFGTLAYMSPEQIDGSAVDARADVYSLGCVLYEMLTGDPPFGRGSRTSVLAGHAVRTPPPLSEARPEAPADLVDLVEAALAKAPGDRPASAGHFEEILEGIQPLSTPGSAPWRVPGLRVFVGAGLAATMGWAAWVSRPGLAPDASPSGAWVVMPVERPDWSDETQDAAWALAREVTAELGRWDGVATVPHVAMVGPMFDLGLDRAPRSLSEAGALARELAADRLVVLDVRTDGTTLDAEIVRVDPSDASVLGSTPTHVSAPAADMHDLAATITLNLLDLTDAVGSGGPARLSDNADAVREYSRGRRLLDRGELGPSREALRAAVDLDPDFALAHHHLALAMYWQGADGSERWADLGPDILRHITRAREAASPLPERERLHIESFHAFVTRDFDQARSGYRRLIEEQPNDSYAHLLLGSVEYRDRMLVDQGRGPTPRANWDRSIASFTTSVRLSPDFSLGYGHLFDIWRELSSPDVCLTFWPERTASALLWEQLSFTDIVPFCPVLGDSIRWAPIPEVNRPDHGNGRLLSRIEDETRRHLERWASYAPHLARPHEELARWTLLVRSRGAGGTGSDGPDSLAAVSLGHLERALEIRRDTTRYDIARLAALHLAAGRHAAAVLLADRAGPGSSPDARPFDFGAHPYLATGRIEQAVEAVREAYPGGRLAARTASGDFVPFAEGEPTVLTLQILGAAGADSASIRPYLTELMRVWAPSAVGEEASLALRTTSLSRISPALLVDRRQVDAWFSGIDIEGIPDLSLVDFWRGWLALPIDAAQALEALRRGVQRLETEPSPSATSLFLYARLAERTGDDALALSLYQRLESRPHPVLDAFEPGWGLENLALLGRVGILRRLGDDEAAASLRTELEARWRDADPSVRSLLR